MTTVDFGVLGTVAVGINGGLLEIATGADGMGPLVREMRADYPADWHPGWAVRSEPAGQRLTQAGSPTRTR